MKRKIRTLVFFSVLLFIFSLTITIPTGNCYSGTGRPIPIKQIFDPPPKPYIDDGVPGLDPNGRINNLFSYNAATKDDYSKNEVILYSNYERESSKGFIDLLIHKLLIQLLDSRI